MEREKKGNFLPNSDFNCIGQGQGNAGKSKQQGTKVWGGRLLLATVASQYVQPHLQMFR